MAQSEDIQSWARKHELPSEVTAVLEENGFSTVKDLTPLTPADIKDIFQDPGLLNIAQCLALRRAVSTLTHTTHPHTPSTSTESCPLPPPLPPPPPYPPHAGPIPQSFEPQPVTQTQPESSQSDSYPHPPQPQPHPSPSQPFLPQKSGTCPPHEWLRFLLLGKTGSGKSTTGNTIFGEQLFSTAPTFESVTSDCERKTNKRGGRKIEILDSPGLYDTHKSPEEIGVVIVQAVAGMHPGPHAILYVVPLGRYTAEEFAAYQRLKALFDDTITRYMIVVFTHGDTLQRDGLSIGDLIGPSTPQNLQQVLRECNNRHVVFNNMATNRQPQVDHLLQVVRELVRENGGQPYSCPKYSNIGQGMEEEVARRLEEVEKRDLQRQKYVQQLEQQTKEAEESARRTQEEFQRNEEERQRQMEAEEERRRQLEDQLQNHIKEQQIGFEKVQEELEQLHQEREEQKRMMREKEAQMSEMEKKRAEEQAEQMRQREQEKQALLAQQEERLSRQRQEDEERRQEMEREKQEFLKRMEEQRKKEIEELEKKNEERNKLFEKLREEEREAAKRREENHEKEMEKMKRQLIANKSTEFFESYLSTVLGLTRLLFEAALSE